MRRVSRFLLLLVVGTAAACQLPERRPEAEFDLYKCVTPTPAGADPNATPTPVVKPGSVFNHHTCVTLDASESAVFTGSSEYLWEKQIGDAAPVTIGTAATVSSIFFRDVVRDLTPVTVILTVTDGAGQSRKASETLTLLNTPPGLTLKERIIRPRGIELVFTPFFVVRAQPDDADCDVDPDAAEPWSIDCDDLDLSVSFLDASSGLTSLPGIRCSEVPAASGNAYADPVPDDRNAWCFPLLGLFESGEIFASPSVDFRFRVETTQIGAIPHGTSCASETDDATLDPHAVACQTIRFEDTLWIASGAPPGGTLPDSGIIGRVVPDWRRLAPPAFLPFNGTGTANDIDGTQWFGGSLRGCESQDPTYCLGGLTGLDDRIRPLTIAGFGSIGDIAADPAGGLWVSALSLDTAFNPGAAGAIMAADSTRIIDPFARYVVHVPPTAYPAANGIVNLANSNAAFTFVRGFEHPSAVPATFEVPIDVVATAAGDLWIASSEFDSTDYSFIASRLRRIPQTRLATGVVVDIDSEAIPDVGAGVLDFPIPGLHSEVLALGGNDEIWVIDAGFDPLQGRLRALSVDGATAAVTIPIDGGIPTALAYDPGVGTAPDVMWVADYVSASVLWYQTPSSLSASGIVPGPFVAVRDLDVDPAGGLWVDSHLEDKIRQPAYVRSDRQSVDFLEPYFSEGAGIVADIGIPRSVWRPDLGDLVRVPTQNTIEIPALTEAPVGVTIVGVDPYDGAAYAFSPTPGENFFRIETDGTRIPLATLRGRPRAGILIPDLAFRGEPTEAPTFYPGSVWLAVDFAAAGPDPGGVRFVELDLPQLRFMSANGTTVDGDTGLCGAAAPPCWRRVETVRLGAETFSPISMALSLAEGRLYAVGETPSGDALVGLNPFSAQFTGDFEILGAGYLRNGVPNPMFVADAFEEQGDGSDLAVGGVWLVVSSGNLERWHTDGTGAVALAQVVARPPGLFSKAGAPDLFFRGLWVSYENTGGSVLIRWNTDIVPGSPPTLVLNSASLPIPIGAGEALAVVPFSSSVWTSGRDGTLRRVSSYYDGTYKLEMKYVRTPDFTGFTGPTPAGRSMFAGGF